MTQLQEAKIEFVLAFVRGATPHQVSERVGRVSDLAVTHGAVVLDLLSSLVVVAYGMPPVESEGRLNRQTLIGALQQGLGGDMKVVHGEGRGHYGNIGSSTRLSWSFILPEFEDALARLCSLEFGQIQEFKP